MTAAQVGLVPAIHSFFCHWNPTYRADAMGRALRYALPLLVVLALAWRTWPGQGGRSRKGSSPGGCTSRWPRPGSTRRSTPGIITPFMVMYALHDAMVKPMPGKPMAPSLAESWTASEDGLTYEFILRKGAKFHNGEPVTAEDVKFSFERYRGTSTKALKDRVAAVETPDPQHVRFKLKQPWPDFLTFYASATGAGWIVPKKYVEKVGDGGVQEGADRRRPLQVRVVHTRASSWSLEAFDAVLAQDARASSAWCSR